MLKRKRLLVKVQIRLNLFACNPQHKKGHKECKAKGASSWLTNLPPECLGYALNRQEFKDNMHLRNNSNIESIPKYCGSGKSNSIDHFLSYKLGEYVIMHHNHITDTVAEIIKEVCFDIQTSPHTS